MKSLTIKAPIKQIGIDVSKLNQLTDLCFWYSELEDYRFIDKIEGPLESLTISSVAPWTGLVDLSRFTDLVSLKIGNCQDEKFNFQFNADSKLAHFHIYYSNFKNIFDTIKLCQNIYSIELQNTHVISFMDLLNNFENCRRMSIKNMDVLDANEIPSQTNKIEYLELIANNIEFENLNFLSKCTALETLCLGGVRPLPKENTINSPVALLRDKPIPLNYAKNNLFPTLKFKKIDVFLKFSKALIKAKLDQKSKEFFLLYIAGCTSMVLSKEWSWETLLKASNINYASFRNKLKELINEKVREQEKISFTKKSVFYITGNPKAKKAELKKQMQDLGLQLVSKYAKEVTHVIIGMKSLDYDLLADKEFIAITDNLIQKAYLDI